MPEYMPFPTEATPASLLQRLERHREQTYELVCEVLKQAEPGAIDLREFAAGGARRWFIEKLQELLNSPVSPQQITLADHLLGMLTADDEHGAFFTSLVKTSLNSPHLDRWLPEIVRWGQQVREAGREVRDLLLGLTLRRLLSQPNTGSYSLLTQAADAIPVQDDTFALDALLKLASQYVQVKNKGGDELKSRDEEVEALRTKLQDTRTAYKELGREIIRSRQEAEEGVLQAIFSALAPALVQLPTMRANKKGGKRLKVEDVLARFDVLERALRDQGFDPLGEVGQVLPFDPHQHAPIEEIADLEPGKPVQVRFIGYQYKGSVLHKAQVGKSN